MEYALIKDGEVRNVIVADPEFISMIQGEWDAIERIDQLEEKPSIGWKYDKKAFTRKPDAAPAKPQKEKAKDDLVAKLAAVNIGSVSTVEAIKPVLADIIELLKLK